MLERLRERRRPNLHVLHHEHPAGWQISSVVYARSDDERLGVGLQMAWEAGEVVLNASRRG